MQFKDHFSDRASTYASRRPSYPPELVEYIAGLAPARNVAWDCGCGSGQMSVPLAKSFARVVATDASSEQIAHATPHPKVEYSVAPAEKTGIAQGSVDLIVVAQSAHWFDLPKFYEEARRVARSGAAIALITYDLLEVTPEIDAIIRDFYHSLPWPPERRLVDERYATISFPFREIAAPPFSIRSDWTVEQLIGYVGTWSGFRDVDSAPFERSIKEAWGGVVRRAQWPISMRAGTIDDRT
jgi:ubiquinone/menaquinone biosynthesis C-methylase UbiE